MIALFLSSEIVDKMIRSMQLEYEDNSLVFGVFLMTILVVMR